MPNRSRLLRRVSAAPLAALAAAAALFSAAAPAPVRADVKIVQERTLTGLAELGAKGIPINSVTYFKGDFFREEFEGRSIVHIYDAAKDRYYTLNRTDRTYMVQTLDEALKTGGVSVLSQLKITGEATIGPGGSTQTIAGRPAANYTIQTSVRLIDERSGAALLNVKLEGDQWTTKSIPFPSKNPNIRRLAYLFSPRASRLLRPYFEKVGEMQGMPLSFDYIISLSGAVNGTFEAHSEVKKISTAPIPPIFFKIPPGYRLVDKVNEED